MQQQSLRPLLWHLGCIFELCMRGLRFQHCYLWCSQGGPAALELSAVDRHDFNSKDPWFEPPGTLSKHGPSRFAGECCCASTKPLCMLKAGCPACMVSQACGRARVRCMLSLAAYVRWKWKQNVSCCKLAERIQLQVSHQIPKHSHVRP